MARIEKKPPAPQNMIVRDSQGNELNEYTPDMIETIKNTVAKGATDNELKMFLAVANKYQLDPFSKQIWFIKHEDKYGEVHCNVMTGVAGYRQIAKRNQDFKICHVEVVFQEDEFKMCRRFGEIVDIIHNYEPSERKSTKPLGAYAVLKTKSGENLATYLSFDEYNTGKGAWATHKSAMIKKAAETDVYKQFCDTDGLDAFETMPKEYTENVDVQLNENEDIEFIDVKIKTED